MDSILSAIKELIFDNRKLYLPHVKDEDLEENGAVYYMNGKNGTEFDWYVNEKISDFFVFYDDENCMGAVKLTLYNNGGIRIYLYDEQGSKLIKEVKTFIDVPKEEILKLAVFLRYETDDRKIWDAKIDDIVWGKGVTADQISEFQGNARFYQDMINRKNFGGCFVTCLRRLRMRAGRLDIWFGKNPIGRETAAGVLWQAMRTTSFWKIIITLSFYL